MRRAGVLLLAACSAPAAPPLARPPRPPPIPTATAETEPPPPEPPPLEDAIDRLWDSCDVDGIPPAKTRRVRIEQIGGQVDAAVLTAAVLPAADPQRFALFAFRDTPEGGWRIAAERLDHTDVFERLPDRRLSLHVVLGRLSGLAAGVTMDPASLDVAAWAASFTDSPPSATPWRVSHADVTVSSHDLTGTVTVRLRLRGVLGGQGGEKHDAVVCAMIDAIVPP
jgi:hypothetical protein